MRLPALLAARIGGQQGDGFESWFNSRSNKAFDFSDFPKSSGAIPFVCNMA